MKSTITEMFFITIILILFTGCSIEIAYNFNNAPRTLQYLSKPKYATIYIEGMPVLVRYYPFSKIAEEGKKGIASYLIFVENLYKVEQANNLLRITPRYMLEHLPEFSMEIIQAPNTTVEEMEYKVMSTFVFYYYFAFRSSPSEYFPFVGLIFYDGLEKDSIVTSIYIKDNTHGGVFVVTTRLTDEAAGGHGVRFRNSLKTVMVY